MRRCSSRSSRTATERPDTGKELYFGDFIKGGQPLPADGAAFYPGSRLKPDRMGQMTKFAIVGALLVVGMSTALAGERLDPHPGSRPRSIRPRPPAGSRCFRSSLENLAIKLKDTPCASNSGPEKRSVQHAAALFLGEGIDEKPNKVVLSGTCQPDGFELPSGIEEDLELHPQGHGVDQEGQYRGVDVDTPIRRQEEDVGTDTPDVHVLMIASAQLTGQRSVPKTHRQD